MFGIVYLLPQFPVFESGDWLVTASSWPPLEHSSPEVLGPPPVSKTRVRPSLSIHSRHLAPFRHRHTTQLLSIDGHGNYLIPFVDDVALDVQTCCLLHLVKVV